MITTVHLFTGAVIGKAAAENIYFSIPIAFLSHYFLDIIPHYSPKPVKSYLEKGLLWANKKDLILKSVEPLFGLFLVFYFIFVYNENFVWPMALGAFFGWLPDFLVFLKWKYSIKIHPQFLKNNIAYRHISFFPGIIIQIFILAFAIWYILYPSDIILLNLNFDFI